MQTAHDLSLLVPEQRTPEAPDDGLRAKVVAVAVARPDLTPAGVADLLRTTGVVVAPVEVAAILAEVDLVDPEERAEFVQLMAPPRPAWRAPAIAVARVVTRFAVGLAVVLLLFLALLPRTGLYQTSTMLTGSMAPGMPVGAALVGTREDVGDVRVGQVLSLRSPLPGRPVVSHRVVEVVTSSSGQIGFRTKGDANPAPDPYVSYPDGDQVWVVRAVIPGLGSLIRVLQGGLVHLLLVVGLPAGLAGWALLQLWRPRRTDPTCGTALP